MKKLPFLFLFLFSIAARGQSVSAYYATINGIVKEFVVEKDTVAFYKNILTLSKKQAGYFAELTASSKLIRNFYSVLGKRKTERLLINLGSNSINYDDFLKTELSEREKEGGTGYYLANLDVDLSDVLRKTKKNYKNLYAKFELSKGTEANEFFYTDQLGRYISDDFDCIRTSGGGSSVVFYTDSLNLVRLYQVIEKSGFPKPKITGQFDYFILFFHTFARSCDYTFNFFNGVDAMTYLDSVLIAEVKNGNFWNSQYAYFKDLQQEYYNCSGKTQLYGSFFIQRGDSYPVADIQNLDSRRAAIYLPPLWQDALFHNFELPDGYPLPDEAKKFFEKK